MKKFMNSKISSVLFAVSLISAIALALVTYFFVMPNANQNVTLACAAMLVILIVYLYFYDLYRFIEYKKDRKNQTIEAYENCIVYLGVKPFYDVEFDKKKVLSFLEDEIFAVDNLLDLNTAPSEERNELLKKRAALNKALYYAPYMSKYIQF